MAIVRGHIISPPCCLFVLRLTLFCCVLCQGFHLLADTYDGFGGIAAALMEDIADNFSGKGLLTLSLTPPVFPDYVTHSLFLCDRF